MPLHRGLFRGARACGSSGRRRCLAGLAIALTLVAAPAAADKFPWQEFENNITTASEVQSLGTDIFGDQVSLQDGALSFSATDVSIPGNNALPVAFERSYRLFNREYYISDEMLADWELELPRISGTYAPNWVGRGGAITDRCSFGGAPPDIQSPVDAMPSETVMSYWQGLQIQIPGVDSGDLLLAPSEAPGPPGGP